jgi:hypothetical protein
MSSQRRKLSSQANGALSRGPTTPEGKLRSSQNAVSHGLLSDCVVLPGESLEGFEILLTQHLERFGPIDGVEQAMIEEMAASYWRMRRAWAMENEMMTAGLNSQPDGDDRSRITASFRQLAASPELALLHRYETRLHLMYQRALHNILLLRAVAKPAESQPEPPAECPPQPVLDPPIQQPPARSSPGRTPGIPNERQEYT